MPNVILIIPMERQHRGRLAKATFCVLWPRTAAVLPVPIWRAHQSLFPPNNWPVCCQNRRSIVTCKPRRNTSEQWRSTNWWTITVVWSRTATSCWLIKSNGPTLMLDNVHNVNTVHWPKATAPIWWRIKVKWWALKPTGVKLRSPTTALNVDFWVLTGPLIPCGKCFALLCFTFYLWDYLSSDICIHSFFVFASKEWQTLQSLLRRQPWSNRSGFRGTSSWWYARCPSSPREFVWVGQGTSLSNVAHHRTQLRRTESCRSNGTRLTTIRRAGHGHPPLLRVLANPK